MSEKFSRSALHQVAGQVTIAASDEVSSNAGQAFFLFDPDQATRNGNTSVADYFLANLKTFATDQYNGSTIFVNSAAFYQLGDALGGYTIFHELLHNVGCGDADLKRSFGIDDDTFRIQGSMSITYKLLGECGH